MLLKCVKLSFSYYIERPKVGSLCPSFPFFLVIDEYTKLQLQFLFSYMAIYVGDFNHEVEFNQLS